MIETSFTIAAIVGGAILLFQFVMMLLGLGHQGHDVGGLHHGDVAGGGFHDGDFSGGHDAGTDYTGVDGGHGVSEWFYEVISIRTLSAAATFYGLTGATARAWGYELTPSFVLASVAGVGALYAVYWMYKQVYRLQHTGTENIRNAVGASAVVYVPIPGKRGGAGKVTFRLQNRLVEYLAVTEDEERLPTGTKVLIVGVVSSDTVRVAKAESAAEPVVSNTTAV